jgi:hypothetical protein
MLLQCLNLFDFVDSDLVGRDNLFFDTVVATGIRKTGENDFGTCRGRCGVKIVSVRVTGMLEQLVILRHTSICIIIDIPYLYLYFYF